MKDNVKPIAYAPRRVALALKDRLKKKLDELVTRKVIEPCNEYTEWAHHLVIVEKRGSQKDLRLCIDPYNLNRNMIDEIFFRA